jgi:hypothetical protein
MERETYPVGGVLDGGRRILVLLGAEDLLHQESSCTESTRSN